jgi:uncharacterized protein
MQYLNGEYDPASLLEGGDRTLFRLIPREEAFFTMFEEMASTILDATHVFVELTKDRTKIRENVLKIKELEHVGDRITHQIMEKLNSTFITPIDSEDICDLSRAMDDILDNIENAANRFITYKIVEIPERILEMALVLELANSKLKTAIDLLPDLKHPNKIKDAIIEIHRLENESDRILRESIGELFEKEKDALKVIKLKEIYEAIERAVDDCEDVADVISSILLKHA